MTIEDPHPDPSSNLDPSWSKRDKVIHRGVFGMRLRLRGRKSLHGVEPVSHTNKVQIWDVGHDLCYVFINCLIACFLLEPVTHIVIKAQIYATLYRYNVINIQHYYTSQTYMAQQGIGTALYIQHLGGSTRFDKLLL